jgi:hypothetical protein
MSAARADIRAAWSLTLFIARNDPGHRPWLSGGAIFCRAAEMGRRYLWKFRAAAKSDLGRIGKI